MRAVLDTNTPVRALIAPRGSFGPVLDLDRAPSYTLLYSAPLLEELVDVLARSRLRNRLKRQRVDAETVNRLDHQVGRSDQPDPTDRRVSRPGRRPSAGGGG